jgi:hypothetical protein
MEMKPFMRYLARSAPYLREVGLVNGSSRAVLALRHAISTSLTGLDLRYIDDMGDLSLVTLLRSRAGRRLRSLRLQHYDTLFHLQWPYAVLNRRRGDTARARLMMSDESDRDSCSGSDGDATNDISGGNDTIESNAAAAPQWQLGPERRLRRLRTVHIRGRRRDATETVHAVFNGKRIVFTPFAVVPPL